MPGARPSIKPLSAVESSGFEDISQLELHLQKQLEEDVAKIFDESIYCDLEVVSGKLKILTHSCILKARTHKFYHKLEAILHVNIGRNNFDEIYSFISDAYTECDIKHQEHEILHYLKDNLNLKTEANNNAVCKSKEDLDESDAYATPDCLSPDESSLHKTISSSPSTELTKEYYALVPLESQILDRELVEQDELSSGFKSFINSETEKQDNQITQCIKPTTLPLNSSHISKRLKHSIICDTKDSGVVRSNSFDQIDKNKLDAASQIRKHISQLNKIPQSLNKGLSVESAAECAYSPDSLIADEPSSSSDYLSTALSASPGAHAPLANMNNGLTTVSDSGIDNNVMLESLNSHKDVTLADVSLTESTLHELLNDESSMGHSSNEGNDKTKSKLDNSNYSLPGSCRLGFVEMSGRSSKDEKQRQNEEIVILESSSLSSETGSWESVFPPKLPERELCAKFIDIERQNSIEPNFNARSSNVLNEMPASQSSGIPFKTSCFIDASSLADDEERRHEELIPFTLNNDIVFRSSSRPVPCESKQDIVSPIDYSESNDNDDSLEQPDPDSIQKDISPTIFEMTLTVEDSLADDYEYNYEPEPITTLGNVSFTGNNLAKTIISHSVPVISTPNNSIISLNTSDYKTYDSESSDTDAASYKRGSTSSVDILEKITEKPTPSRPAIRHDIMFDDFHKKYNESSPIISGGASIEDHLPKLSYVGSPMAKRKIENIPIVSGAYIPQGQISEKTHKSPQNAAAWVVDMSKSSKSDDGKSHRSNKPGDKTCDILKASSKSTSNSESCKSRSSIDSDSSEKSTHKFYIDLSTLPDALASDESSVVDKNEKKNIFSMFIDLGENSSTVKEMPARLSSSLNTKKTKPMVENKPIGENKTVVAKTNKVTKKLTNPTNGNVDNVFEKLESLCDSPQLSLSEILQQTKYLVKEQNEDEITQVKECHRSFLDNVAPTIEEEPDIDQSGDIFVRLSDLDRAPIQKETEPEVARVTGPERMTRSIPDNNWVDSSQTSSRSIDIISSFHSENALSLNRLFPHLKNDLSRSMPGSLSGRSRSPHTLAGSSLGDRDDQVADGSEISVDTSLRRSVMESTTTEDTSHTSSLMENCQSRLGQDLLRMFTEEIAPDVVVEVSGRRIKAHKCILSSRCQYFAGILSGGWVESAGNVISLPPFSFSVVHFALCHIYSGASTIPDSVSMVELATIADMLGLEGLKEAIMFTLKSKYCHHFHEPCHVCIAGVLESITLSSVYGLDDLFRRCLRWITKYFREVWPTKAFATLPSDLLEKCFQQLLASLSADNFAEIVLDCGDTVSSLQRCRWAGAVERLCRRLITAAGVLGASHLSSFISTVIQNNTPSSALDDVLATAIANATPEEISRALAILNSDIRPETVLPNMDRYFTIRRRCEDALIKMPCRAINSTKFNELPSELRRRIRTAARLQPEAPIARRPRRGPEPRNTRMPRGPPVGEAPREAPSVRTTKAQEERARFNLNKSTEKVKTTNGSKATLRPGVKPRAPYENAKPRYLEPRAGSSGATGAIGADRSGPSRLRSSSESSRNSSPVLPRARRPATLRPQTAPNPTTDNSNRYATYIKRRGKCPNETTNQPKPAMPFAQRRTRIPVFRGSPQSSTASAVKERSVPSGSPQASTASTERSVPSAPRSRSAAPQSTRPRGSLMMATQSSSAKMVVREPPSPRPRPDTRRKSPPAPIPVMERSDTFLKDEPTFGNITTNLNIDTSS